MKCKFYKGLVFSDGQPILLPTKQQIPTLAPAETKPTELTIQWDVNYFMEVRGRYSPEQLSGRSFICTWASNILDVKSERTPSAQHPGLADIPLEEFEGSYEQAKAQMDKDLMRQFVEFMEATYPDEAETAEYRAFYSKTLADTRVPEPSV